MEAREEESLRLMAAQRDIGRVQVEHNLLRRHGVRLDSQIREQRIDLLRGKVNLVKPLRAFRMRLKGLKATGCNSAIRAVDLIVLVFRRLNRPSLQAARKRKSMIDRSLAGGPCRQF